MNSARLTRLLQTAAVRWIDPLFARRHPGPELRKLIRAMGPLVRQLQLNDRWSLEPFIGEWVRLLDIPPVLPLPQAKRIFIFSCYRGQIGYDVLWALLFAWRGHSVTLGYLPKLQSPIKDPVSDHPDAADYLKAVLGGLVERSGGRVRCLDLSDWAGCSPVRDEAYLAAQTRADIIMRIRQEKYDLRDPETAWANSYYAELNRRSQQIAWAFLEKHRAAIDLCVIANGASFEAGQFCHVAKKLGIPVNTHEKFAFSNVRVITHGDQFFQFSDLDRIWARRAELGFENEPVRGYLIGRAWDLLGQRRSSSGRAWGWQYQKGRQSYGEDELRAKYGIEKDRFALVCPNVPFDAGYDGWLQIFPTMRDWLVQTIEALLRVNDLQIVLRAHPAETRPGFGREKIAEVLKEAGIASPRLIALPGNSEVNTYDLMPLCRFGVVFASTTGIEIAMHGKPVLAGASVYYARCGLTVAASDRDAYFARLVELADGTRRHDADPDEAALLYFVFHYLLQWPFPYDKPSQITACPPRRLAQDPLIQTYARTLDILAMTVPEYERALPDLADLRRLAAYWGWAPIPDRTRGRAA